MKASLKRACLLAGVVGVSTVVLAGTALAQAADPQVGTWKLNVAKSKFDPGPAPTSMTRTVVAQGNGVKYSFEGVGADGKPVAYNFSVNFDGKDNPIMGSMPAGADTISAVRKGDSSFEATLKKGGKVIGTSKVTVSKDGKVTTVETHGTTAAGAKQHDVQVYEKQ
jgi:hypothetical protein